MVQKIGLFRGTAVTKVQRKFNFMFEKLQDCVHVIHLYAGTRYITPDLTLGICIGEY